MASTTANQRVAEFLLQSDQSGVPFRKAAIVAAISDRESNSTFRIPRNDMLIYPPECYPTRQILLLEEGNPALGTSMPKAWTADPEIMRRLNDVGWLNKAGTGLVSQFGKTDSLDTPNDAYASMFEWLIDKRKSAALSAFSIGPTQIFLKQAPLTGGKIDVFPKTFEDLWTFYTATEAAPQWRLGFWDYLKTDVASYPTPASTVCGSTQSATCVERYLQSFQTGLRDWSDPFWNNYARGFLGAVNRVWASARATGYNNDPRGDINKSRAVA